MEGKYGGMDFGGFLKLFDQGDCKVGREDLLMDNIYHYDGKELIYCIMYFIFWKILLIKLITLIKSIKNFYYPL